MKTPRPKKLTSRHFRRYGKLIEYPNKNKKGRVRNLWRIVDNEPAKVGWRVAYLVLRDRTIGRLESHPTSKETFEPVKGQALFFVSVEKNLEKIDCFLLDRPIILNKGVWHGLIALGRETEIKITENDRISCRYWPLGFRIKEK